MKLRTLPALLLLLFASAGLFGAPATEKEEEREQEIETTGDHVEMLGRGRVNILGEIYEFDQTEDERKAEVIAGDATCHLRAIVKLGGKNMMQELVMTFIVLQMADCASCAGTDGPLEACMGF